MANQQTDPFGRIGQAAQSAGPGPAAPKDDNSPSDWVRQVPSGAPASPDALQRADRSWHYRDADGTPMGFIVARYTKAGAGKRFGQFSLWRNDDGSLEWRPKTAPKPRPLYGLPALAAKRGSPCLIVEGEKAADQAAELFPEYAVITWAAGARAEATADWSPLAGRDCIIWPDNDEEGFEAARRLELLLRSVGARSVGTVALPDLPPKWDLGDVFPDDLDSAAARALIEDCLDVRSHEVTWPKNYHADSAGLWWTSPGNGKGDEPPPAMWLCGPLKIAGMVRDEDQGNWGTAIEFVDHDGRPKQMVIPRADLAGEAIEIRRRLMAAGLTIRSDRVARERLMNALAGVRCTGRARLAYASGWAGQDAYVLPSGALGRPAENILYSGPQKASYHGHAGSYERWRARIADRCRGNAVLLFGLSCAFAAPLLRPLVGEGGGFHFRGGSSCGKTTALEVAGSVWGGGGNQGFVQTWRATPNAVESIAYAHNDGLLCFDEIKTLGGEAAGDAAYGLATGQMKGRQNSNSDLRARISWLVLILSSGEISLEDLVKSGKTRDRVYAGQELRLVDLNVEVTRVNDAWSAWQTTHDAASHADFSDQLKAAALADYGHAGPLFIERFIGRRAELESIAAELRERFIEDVLEAGDTGQIRRGAERFALVAVAGELSTLVDVTPWAPGEASAAAAFLFERWARAFGRKRAREDGRAIQEVRAFIERWEHSRFRSLKDGLTEEEALAAQVEDGDRPRQGEARSLDLAGWKSIREGKGQLFHFNSEFWRTQLFTGLGWEAATKALKAAGYLVTDKEPNRLTHKVRVPGGGTRPFYTVSGQILSAEMSD